MDHPLDIPVFSNETHSPITVVLDPGHGGEDGGAVSPDGVAESHVNLAIALQVHDLLRFCGQPTKLIRTEDCSVHTEGDTMRARKVSDIHHRVAMVNETEHAVLLSIHQNSLPSSPVTYGAQVFWNSQSGAKEMAEVIQDVLNRSINVGNEKQPKQIPSTIYLMKHVTVPAVLIECGFLSNAEETARLTEVTYQQKISTAIAAGYLRCLYGVEQL